MVIIWNTKEQKGEIFTTKTGAAQSLGVSTGTILRSLKLKCKFRGIFIACQAEPVKNKRIKGRF